MASFDFWMIIRLLLVAIMVMLRVTSVHGARGSCVKEGMELFTGAPVKTLKLAIYLFLEF
jgi:hypothetical protein